MRGQSRAGDGFSYFVMHREEFGHASQCAAFTERVACWFLWGKGTGVSALWKAERVRKGGGRWNA